MFHLRAAGDLLMVGLMACAAPALAGPSLPDDPLRALAARLNTPRESLSVWVQAVDEPRPRYVLNPLVARNPASTAKLLTTFVALDLQGPDHVWRTDFHAAGTLRGDTLEGDLLIRGGGDPWLTEDRFWRMLGELRARGLRRITGDLLIDASRFAAPTRAPGDFDGQATRLYNVLPHALLVNFKAVMLGFTPTADGRVEVDVTPALPGLRVDNRLALTEGHCAGVESVVQITEDGEAGGSVLRLAGNYPRACGRQILHRSFLTPEAYAHALFTRLWAQWDGEFAGRVRAGVRAKNHRLLLRAESAPLAEVLRPLNKWSNNPMADAVFLGLGARPEDTGLDATRAAAHMKAYLTRAGISTQGLVMENGSGLSRHSRVSAQTMAGLLRHAWSSRYMPEFLASLSIVGVDGTLRKRFSTPPERGWMHLKSGYLNGVSAVAGYVRAQSGKIYVVCFFLNGPHPSGRALGDALLRWTWQH